jgi:Asp-tRNA(Asn)/Glu-tRNA(Gln) amidotransferase A subunit family amidase
LHGIPWGAKDLIGYPGYPTTWGAPQFKDRILEQKATVARRLEEAGAVLTAKLSLGALAQGDQWFRGQTRNPWNPQQGSSGSSAGSAAATAAGLVGFSLGSETLGSIVSPARRCGCTGLRPTFGRVSRFGCMTLSWSMDKIGPIARSVEDCALVLDAIHGTDGLDPTVSNAPFEWPARGGLSDMRVGFDADQDVNQSEPLRVLSDLGVQLVPIRLPDRYPVRAVAMTLDVEAATVFDELTRSGDTEGLNSWPRTFWQSRVISAVDYLRANRVRTLLMREMEQLMNDVDLYVGIDDLALANLTGHPTVVVPSGFRLDGDVEVPTALTFTGQLFGESALLGIAHAYQQATLHHLRHPDMESLLANSP